MTFDLRDYQASRKRAVLFDLGGTIFKGRKGRRQIATETLLDLGYSVTKRQVAQAYRSLDKYEDPEKASSPSPRVFSKYWNEYNIKFLRRMRIDPRPATVRALRTAFAWLYQPPFDEKYQVFPDVLPCLNGVRKAGLRIGAVTNTGQQGPHTLNILCALGVSGYFEYVVNSYNVRIFKPDPRIFTFALNHFGVSPRETLFIGDKFEADVLGAFRAGIPPVLLDRGSRTLRRHPKANTCPVIGSLRDLADIMRLRW